MLCIANPQNVCVLQAFMNHCNANLGSVKLFRTILCAVKLLRYLNVIVLKDSAYLKIIIIFLKKVLKLSFSQLSVTQLPLVGLLSQKQQNSAEFGLVVDLSFKIHGYRKIVSPMLNKCNLNFDVGCKLN